MLSGIDKYCRECTVCQRTKPPAPASAPLVNAPIGKAWEMVAVDILEVSVSHNNNCYSLAVQDYMTKWIEAILIPNQTAKRITTELSTVTDCQISSTLIKVETLKVQSYIIH